VCIRQSTPPARSRILRPDLLRGRLQCNSGRCIARDANRTPGDTASTVEALRSPSPGQMAVACVANSGVARSATCAVSWATCSSALPPVPSIEKVSLLHFVLFGFERIGLGVSKANFSTAACIQPPLRIRLGYLVALLPVIHGMVRSQSE
jgi:hypothetical protein